MVVGSMDRVSVSTLMMGLPGESTEDIGLTVQLVRELRTFKSLMVPLSLISLGALEDKVDSFRIERMSREHCELLFRCWEHNFRWFDRSASKPFYLTPLDMVRNSWMSAGIGTAMIYLQ